MTDAVQGSGTKDDPWKLKTPSLTSDFEAWARSDDNPVGGYYGVRKGYRGRFANYVTPVLELLGLAELEHEPRNNRARAK